MPREKIVAYLLDPDHPVGGSKAVFFLQHGFTVKKWREFAHALISIAQRYDVEKSEQTPFGERYTIVGRIAAPNGRSPWVRTVWMIDYGHTTPRFITAYPHEEPTE